LSAVEDYGAAKYGGRRRTPTRGPGAGGAVPIRRATITSPIRALGARLIQTPLVRSVLRKIPGVKRFVPGSAQRVRRMETSLGLAGRDFGGTAPGVLARARPLIKTAAKVGAIGGAFAIGEEAVKRTIGATLFDEGPNIPLSTPRVKAPQINLTRSAQMAKHQQLAVGSVLPPSHQVVKAWQTFPGGPVFAKLADGHIAVQKKDGTIKHFRPYRPVVIPKRWNASSMRRVATALKRQRKTATKIMQITGGMPKGRK